VPCRREKINFALLNIRSDIVYVYDKLEWYWLVDTLYLLTWMQTSLMISVNASENVPILPGPSSSLSFIYKYWYSTKKISKWSDTYNSNSSKMMADSSDFFQVTYFGLSEIFRLSHTPSSLPDCHHYPHSKSEEHLPTLTSFDGPIRHLLILIKSEHFLLLFTLTAKFYTKTQQKMSRKQFPIQGHFLLKF